MYEEELEIAELTVQRAVIVTKTLMASVKHVDAMDKDDSTPVTIGDLAAQALIISALHSAFPEDRFLGEESASMLRADGELAKKVWDLVSSTHLEDVESDGRLATPKSVQEMMDIIDLGQYEGGKQGRIWMLDPIDGTATFVIGQQYAVCLCLVEDGEEKVAALGCPNMSLAQLPITETTTDDDGYLVSAVRGQGAFVRRLSRSRLQPSQRATPKKWVGDPSNFRNVDSVASNTMDQKKHQHVCEKLGTSWPGTDIWAQQMKYIALAVGGHDLVVRIPVHDWHRTAAWDHAGGSLICEEIGYKSTDLAGKPLDFGAGRRLYNNWGNVVAPYAVHAHVLKIVQEALRPQS